MGRYRGVLLDVDGTLVDSNDAHAHAWVEVFAEHHIAVDYARVRRMIGMGGDHLIEEITGLAKTTPEHRAIAERRAVVFRERWLSQVRPIPGARDLVLRLRAEGYAYAIASSAKADELEALLAIANLRDLCTIKTSADDAERSKPDPDIIEAALAEIAVERSQAVLIGDTPYDIEAARRAHVDTIAMTTGGWRAEELVGAIAVYAGPAALLADWSRSPLA